MHCRMKNFGLFGLLVMVLGGAGLFTFAQVSSALDAEKIAKAADTKATTTGDVVRSDGRG
jgi:hypothetical protein